MSVFSTKYENAQNVSVTIGQITTKREAVALYLNNAHLFDDHRNLRLELLQKLDKLDEMSTQSKLLQDQLMASL